jgi:hypothetical protein
MKKWGCYSRGLVSDIKILGQIHALRGLTKIDKDWSEAICHSVGGSL